MEITEEQHIQFKQEVLDSIHEIWTEIRDLPENLDNCLAQPGWFIARCASHPYHAALVRSVRRLRERYPDMLGELATEMYFRPMSWWNEDAQEAASSTDEQQGDETEQIFLSQQLQDGDTFASTMRKLQQWGVLPAGEAWREGAVEDASQHIESLCQQLKVYHQKRRHMQTLLQIMSILNACIIEAAPPDIHKLIETYLYADVAPHDNAIWGSPRSHQLKPHDCLNLLVGLEPSPSTLALIGSLRRGPRTGRFAQIYYDVKPFHVLLRNLFAGGMLSYEIFRHIALLTPHFFISGFCIDQDSEAFRQQIAGYQQQLVAETAQNLSESNFDVILAYRKPLHGADWLLEAARLHSALQVGELIGVAGNYSPETLKQAIIRLARAQDVEPASALEQQELIEHLQCFPETTLRALFGVAAHARRILCIALGWQEALPLVELVEEIAKVRLEPDGNGVATDIPNSEDPSVGVLDIAAVRAVLAQVGDELAHEVLRLLCRGQGGVERTATLVQAVAGWNRSTVFQGIKRYGQLSIKAYGALPLLRGEEEVMERYQRLQQIALQGQKFNATRRATHAAAVQAALSNLAQVAGYHGADHLEWEMEARIVKETALSERVWNVGEYQLRVVLEGVQAAISVVRAGRTLKSVPKEVRASSAYQEAKDAVVQLRTHISRLRKGLLERLLITGEMLTPEQLSHIISLPTARALLEMLVLRAEDGMMGLLEADGSVLRGLDGTRYSIAAPLTIAHPCHLFEAGVLSEWQQEMIHRRIVQPVKQVFRELYVLTPAEQEARTSSSRFAGHSISGSTALRLLTGRGWRIWRRTYENPYAYKSFPGLRVTFELATSGHYLGEPGSSTTTGQIYFETRPSVDNQFVAWRSVPLEEVPPLIFSEVMRDADLVVSVAQEAQGGRETYFSQEMYVRTGELVSALLSDIGLQGVTVDRHFAYVQGKLARYRVHLGSAAIHIEPGSYLCIVPANWGQTHEKLFLPFVDDSSGKISEVISKILLLLNDNQIKDESILRQIRLRLTGRE